MSQIYITQQFDELDAICWRYYGRTQGTVEAVMEVNQNLAELLPLMPEGVTILLPDLPQPETTTTLRIWDP
jgi:phage tail protein X